MNFEVFQSGFGVKKSDSPIEHHFKIRRFYVTNDIYPQYLDADMIIITKHKVDKLSFGTIHCYTITITMIEDNHD